MKNKKQVGNFVLQSPRISSHPKLEEILDLIETLKDEQYIEVIYEILQNGMTLDSEYLIDILNLIVNSKETSSAWAIKAIMTEPKLLKDERLPEIIEILKTSSNYGVIFIGRLIVDNNILLREDALDILKVVKDITPNKTSEIVNGLLKKHSLGKADLEIIMAITTYKGLAKLNSIQDHIISPETGLLENPDMKDVTIETIKHFKNCGEDGTSLFSCIELFDEKTDPTIERELDQNKAKILKMSRIDQIRVLSRTRTMLNYTEKEIKHRANS